MLEELKTTMEPLALHQQMMTWMFISSSNKNLGKFQRTMHVAIGFTIFAGLIIGIIASFAYLIKYLSIDLERSLYTTFQLTTCGSAAYVFALACLSRHKIGALFNSLNDICNERKYFSLLIDFRG